MHVVLNRDSLTHVHKGREPVSSKTKVWTKNPQHVRQSPTEMLFGRLTINALS